MAEKNLVLGRGRLYFDQFTDGTLTSAKGERYIGNCSSFSYNTSSDKLEHYSSEGGLKVLDKTVTLQTTRNAALTTDNISADNLAQGLNGLVQTVTQASGTALSETKALYKGRFYQIGQTSSNPSGVRKIANFVLKTTGGSPVTIAMSGNYKIDLELGRLEILDTAVAITNGTTYSLEYDTTASSREQIISKSSTVYGALRYIADNATGTNRDTYMPYVEMSPDGDYALIGDEWQAMNFNVGILKLNDTTEAIYVDGRAVIP